MYHRPFAFRPVLLVIVAGLAAGCGKKQPEQPAAAAPLPPSAIAPVVEDRAKGPERVPELDARETPPGWKHFARQNDVPLCVFANERAALAVDFVSKVKKQRLVSKPAPYLTVFASDCVSARCVTAPTLECWAELVDGDVVVQSRYSGNRQDEQVCTEGCEPITASCPLPQLAPGTHVIRYGVHSLQLKLPGILQKPCIATD